MKNRKKHRELFLSLRRDKSHLRFREINDLLREAYELSALGAAGFALYRLIDRYDGKVSERLLLKKESLRQLAKKSSIKMLESLIYSNNPFLSVKKAK